MKTTKKFLCILLVLLICIGGLTGCSEASESEDNYSTTNEIDTGENTYTDQEEVPQSADILGEVTYAGTDYFSMTVYEAQYEITDYTDADVSAWTETGDVEYIYPDADAEFYLLSDATLVSAYYEDVLAGCMIAVTVGSDGTQQIIILTENTVTEEDDMYYTDTVADTVIIAEVTAVNDDDSLSLLNYVSEGDGIEDCFAADLTQFTSDGTYYEYTVPTDAIVYLTDTDSIDEITADGIIVGDMLVIFTDSTGVTYVVIYPADTTAADTDDTVVCE